MRLLAGCAAMAIGLATSGCGLLFDFDVHGAPPGGGGAASSSANAGGGGAGGARCPAGDRFGANPALAWRIPIGNAAPDAVEGIAANARDEVVITGYFSGTLDLGKGEMHAGPGPQGHYAAKYDRHGSLVWSKYLSSSDAASFPAIAPDGEVYVAGTSFPGTTEIAGVTVPAFVNRHDYVVRLDKDDGAAAWLYQLATPDSSLAGGIAYSPFTQSVAYVGWFNKTAGLGAGTCAGPMTVPLSDSFDGFFVSLDDKGTSAECGQAFQIGGSANQTPTQVVADADGNFAIVVPTSGDVDIAGLAPVPASPTDAVLVGASKLGAPTFATRLGALGGGFMVASFEGTASVVVSGAVKQKPVMSITEPRGGYDIPFIRVDAATGAITHADLFGSSGDDSAYVAVHPVTGTWLAGAFTGALEGGAKKLLGHTDADGFLGHLSGDELAAAVAFGPTTTQVFGPLAVGDRLIFVTGIFAKKLDFDACDEIASQGNTDVVLAAFRP